MLGLVTAGVGAGVGIGGFLVSRAGVAKHDSIVDDIAHQRPYDPANGNYKTLGGVGLAMMVGGAVGLAGGAIIFFLADRARSSEASAPAYAVACGLLPVAGWGGGFVAQLGSRF